jgi:RND family efflux transporter MFP subunit
MPNDTAGHHVPTHFGPLIGRIVGALVFVLILMLGTGAFFVHQRHAQATARLKLAASAVVGRPPVVDVVRVKYAAGADSLTMPGGTSGWYESTIYARVSGYVAGWTADIGDHVKSGQVLATIDTPDLDARLMAARAKLAAAESDVDVAQSNVALAKTTYDRWWSSPQGAVSQQERDEKKAEYESSVAKLKAAQAQIKVSEADVTSLVAFTEYKKVTAPFDGIITGRKIDIGDLVKADSASGTSFLYSIAQVDQLRVFVDVPQAASACLRTGMPATLHAGEFPNRKFTGKIARTSNAMDPASRTLRVEVDIENRDFALVPGMYLQVTFDVTQKPLLQVPASALLFRAASPQVALVSDDGKIHFQSVTIADDQGDLVDIGAGVSANEKVAVNLSSQVADGDRVTASEVDQSPSAASPATQPSAGSSAPER